MTYDISASWWNLKATWCVSQGLDCTSTFWVYTHDVRNSESISERWKSLLHTTWHHTPCRHRWRYSAIWETSNENPTVDRRLIYDVISALLIKELMKAHKRQFSPDEPLQQTTSMPPSCALFIVSRDSYEPIKPHDDSYAIIYSFVVLRSKWETGNPID